MIVMCQMSSNFKGKYCKGVWREGDKEYEDTFPSKWIQGKILRWPRETRYLHIRNLILHCTEPEENWYELDLVKIRMSDDDYDLCLSFWELFRNDGNWAIRSANSPLAQVVKMLDEIESCNTHFAQKHLYTKVGTGLKDGWFITVTLVSWKRRTLSFQIWTGKLCQYREALMLYWYPL